MSSIIRSLRLALVPVLIAALGCATTSESELPLAPAPEPSKTESIPVAESSVPSLEVREVSPALAPVYFDTNRAELGPEALDVIESYAKSILDHPEWGVLRIEGHCDERGSDEHNLTLGMRRAAAVRRHLVEMGVPPSRLVTQTFGAQRPAVLGHNEAVWRYNRRSELRTANVLASTGPDSRR
jgi:peptidoglycan-associated lipoprotein